MFILFNLGNETALNALECHTEDVMLQSDHQAYDYPPLGNTRVFRRVHYWDDALEASLDPDFM